MPKSIDLKPYVSQETTLEGKKVYVFNPEGSTTMTLRKGEAGRVVQGLRRFLEGEVDPRSKIIASENDPTYGFAWDLSLERAVTFDLIPTASGRMRFQQRLSADKKPVLDYGYTHLNGDYAHQVTSNAVALLSAMHEPNGGIKFVVPVNEGDGLAKAGDTDWIQFQVEVYAPADPKDRPALLEAYLATHQADRAFAYA